MNILIQYLSLDLIITFKNTTMRRAFLLLIMLSLVLTTSYASFPVNKKSADKHQVTEQSIDRVNTVEVHGALLHADTADAISPAVAASSDDNTFIITLVLWFFLAWPFAAHRWYRNKPAGWNILFIITFAGFGIWALVDLINILTDNF